MFKQLSKWATGAAVAIALVSPLALSQPAYATTNNVGDLWGSETIQKNVVSNSGLGDKDPREVVGLVIKYILGFLGIIAVVIIMLAGFQYMTAGGDPIKAEEARGKIMAAVIGLVIILAAYGITNFVLTQALTASGI
jgi:hypothetical protein